MRGKTRRADKDDENGNRRDEKGGAPVKDRGLTSGQPLVFVMHWQRIIKPNLYLFKPIDY